MNTSTMKSTTMKWLLQREFWEHKGSMFWAPLIVAGLLIALIGGSLAYGVAQHGLPMRVMVNGHVVHTGTLAAAAEEMRPMVAKIASGLYLGAAAPLFGILTVVVFFYCLGALYDERRDRSILFWKSLPVSDPMTVLSKVATALIVAPMITIALGAAASLILLLFGCAVIAVYGVNLFGVLFATPELFLAPLRLLALLPVYIVWALPTIGWLLLVSSWARTKPFLWAVGAPLVTLMLVNWVNIVLTKVAGTPLGFTHAASGIVARMLAGVVPGIWFTFPGVVPNAIPVDGNSLDVSRVFVQSWMSLATLDALLGVLAGAAMIYVAMRMRRWRDEG
jgi:ABC-2 type transport system permease protein